MQATITPGHEIVDRIHRYPPKRADDAPADPRAGRFDGAAVLVP